MKLPLGKLVPGVAGLIVGVGGLLGVSYAFGGGVALSPQKADTSPLAHDPIGVMYPTRERIVNLADTGILRYLKTTIVLEVFDPENPNGHAKGEEHKKGKEELPKDLRAKSPVIEDKITAILSAKTASELMTTEGKQRLKEEIKSELNKALHEERILAVYFTDFIIQ